MAKYSIDRVGVPYPLWLIKMKEVHGGSRARGDQWYSCAICFYGFFVTLATLSVFWSHVTVYQKQA